MARSMKRNEFRFLISQRVPNSCCPLRRTDTFASQRKEPSCILPSQIPSQTTSPCSVRAYATASAAERNSGSVTISSKGVPARFRSMPLEDRSEEHTSELQSLMRISYAVFCLQKKKHNTHTDMQDTDTIIQHI